MKMTITRLLRSALPLALLLLTACGGGSGGGGGGGGPAAVAPIIARQPASVSVTVGTTAIFSILITGGTEPVTYQWKRNGTAIAGATGDSYTTPATVIGDDAATFVVDIINPAGTLSSATATLTVSAVAEHLYVAYAGAIYVFDIATDGTLTGPSRTIAGSNTTLNAPGSIAVDSLGRLYVVNYGHDVAVFAPGASGNVAPVETLLVGQNPYYVSYQAVAFLTNPAVGMTLPCCADPIAPTDFDFSTVAINYAVPTTIPSNGTMIPPYVTSSATSFASYQWSGTRGLNCTSSVAAANNGNGNVQCYTSPLTWVTGTYVPGTAQISSSGFGCCYGALRGLMFLPDGRLVTSKGMGYIYATLMPASVDTYVIPGDLSTLNSITPVTSISGINTHLDSPASLAYDKQGNLYVSDRGQGSGTGGVRVYAPDATGNVSPLRELLLGLDPAGIAIGP